MSSPIRILVLEDDPVMRDTLHSILDEEGYQVCAVAAGVEAIEQVKQGSFDLLLADVRMEGMDGLTAIEHVRRLTPGIRSLVVSGYCNEADTIRALRLGVGDFIKKPFELQDLIDAVHRQVVQKREDDRRETHQEAFRLAILLALESKAQLLDGKGERFTRTGGLSSVARWAEAMALDQGLSPEAAQDCGILCLLWAVGRLKPDPRLAKIEQAMADPVPAVLQELREGKKESRLAQMVVTVLRFADLADKEVESLLKVGVEPALVESLQRLEEDGLESVEQALQSRRQGRRRRGLMALAAALQSKGDLAGARVAFQAVLKESEVTLESVEAALGLAGVLQRAGKREACLKQLEQAMEASSRLGPHIQAVTGYKAGLQAREAAPEWSEEQLRRACRTLAASGDSPELVKAKLGLWVLKPQSVKEEELASLLGGLGRQVYSDELAACAPWLAPALLERCPGQPQAQQLLFQIARLLPGEYQRLIASQRLSPEARAALVPVLARANTAGARRTLEILSGEQGPAGSAARQAARTESAEEQTLIRLYSLGTLEVYRGEERIPDRAWKRLKNRLLFARLAIAGPVSEDLLIEDFWPGDAEKGRQNIYSAVSVTRRCITGQKGSKAEVITRTGLGLALSPQLPLWHDTGEVLENLKEAARCESSGRRQETYERLKRVYKLYRGPYLEGCYQDWAVNLRHQLENDIMVAFGKLCGWLEEQQRGEELGEFARWMLNVDPCSQQAHLSVMRSLLLTERPEEAVRHFERTRALLAQELAMEPSIDLLREHQKALLSLP